MTEQSPPQSGRSYPAPNPRLVKFLSQPLILEEAGPPRAVMFMLLAASFLVSAFIIWAAVTEIQETALARGQVMPAGSVRVVQHLEGGIVAEVLVEDGQVVEAGQPVLRLQETAALAERDQLRARETALALQAERLRAFVAGRAADFSAAGEYGEIAEDQQVILEMQSSARESQRAVLESRIEQRKAELRSLAAQRKSLKQQVENIRQQLEIRRRLLEKGLVSRIKFLDTENAYNQAQRDLSALDGDAARAKEAIAEARNSLVEMEATLSNNAVTEMGDVTAELAQVREQLTKLNDRVERLAIPAPARGIVKGLVTRTIGQVIAPGDRIMEIVPIDDDMVAEVHVEPRDVGHLRVGQEARVKVTTYDIARHGVINGTLSHISASTFQDESGQPFYRATIALEQNYVGTSADHNPVLPGMVVDADIRTGSKSLLRYLLKPVFRSLDIAFSER